jgi:hypothetical protein
VESNVESETKEKEARQEAMPRGQEVKKPRPGREQDRAESEIKRARRKQGQEGQEKARPSRRGQICQRSRNQETKQENKAKPRKKEKHQKRAKRPTKNGQLPQATGQGKGHNEAKIRML